MLGFIKKIGQDRVRVDKRQKRKTNDDYMRVTDLY